MQLEPNDLLLFARVADEGSFSRAAERIGLPKSTVSRRVAQLETQLGERLLLRTTRKLTVTDFGHSVLAHAHQVADEVDAAAALALTRQAQPSGRLRVSMPGDFANTVLSEMLARFIVKYPAITLELDLSPRRVDLIGENFDVAIRMGHLPDDASLAARKLADFSNHLYASPTYLKIRGTPKTPEDLQRHDALRLLTRNGEPQPWILSRDGEQREVQPPARATVNSPDLLMRLACDGVGIVGLGDHYAHPNVSRGELVPVLPDWELPAAPAWGVFPGRRLMPSRTRVFLDAVQEVLSGPGCRAKEEEVKKSLGRKR
jgi:DNA-binding transcriptional LysR family regulator